MYLSTGSYYQVLTADLAETHGYGAHDFIFENTGTQYLYAKKMQNSQKILTNHSSFVYNNTYIWFSSLRDACHYESAVIFNKKQSNQ
jgi:hypothetical protein